MRRREFIELLGGGSTGPAAWCASQQPVIIRHVSGGCWPRWSPVRTYGRWTRQRFPASLAPTRVMSGCGT